MTQKLYLRDATTTVAGTLPSSTTKSVSNPTPGVTATGAGTNRSMSATPGSAQVAATLTSLASTTKQDNWFRRFISPPLAGQSLNCNATINLANQTASASISPWTVTACVYIWRPSTGALVQSIQDVSGGLSGTNASAAETGNAVGGSTAPVLILFGTPIDGDVLVFELWGDVAQSMSTAELWSLYYEGTTDPVSGVAISSAASYISFSSDIPLYVPSIIVPQAANNSSGASPLVSAKPPKGKLFIPENMMDLGSRSRLPNQNWSTGVFVPPSDTAPPTVDFTIVGR